MYVIIVGGGNVGQYLAQDLIDTDNDVVLIENDEKTADKLASHFGNDLLVIYGDGCDSSNLVEAGINQADVLVAATGLDDSNLVTCELALRVFDVGRVIARVNGPRNARVFASLCIECVSATQIIAMQIQQDGLLNSMSIAADMIDSKIIIERYHMGELKNDLEFTEQGGTYAQDIDMPPGSSIICIEGSEGREIVDPDTQIFSNDSVIYLCSKAVARQAKLALQGLCKNRLKRKVKKDDK